MRLPSLADDHYGFRGQALLLGPRESDRAWTVLSPHCEPNDALIRLVKRDKTDMIARHFEKNKKFRRMRMNFFDGFGTKGCVAVHVVAAFIRIIKLSGT